MGGSFALSLKKKGLVTHIIGYDANQEAMDLAKSMGVIDSISSSACECAQGSDAILLAVPVSATETTLAAMLPALSNDTLVMDVGSTKQEVAQIALDILGKRNLAHCFVPAHPICGREVSGVQHALSDLFERKKVILTPHAALDADPAAAATRLARAKDVWQSLGCEVFVMSPQEHDATFAAVSHLPHFAAFAGLLSLLHQTQGLNYMQFGGTGFSDFTRIAASDPVMWRDILLSNKKEVLLQSRLLRQQLELMESFVAADDGVALQACLSRASAARAEWPRKKCSE